MDPSGSQTPHNPPFSRPFALRIKQVQYVGNASDPHTKPGPDFLWRPSDTGQFIPENASAWWIWDPGWHQPYHGLQRLRPLSASEFSSYRPYKSCTMIWAPERQHYLHIPIDRTTANQGARVWRRLSFGHDEHSDRPDIAVVGHSLLGEWLHLPGPDRWFPQLLPIAYQAQKDNPRRCRLAGDLGILIGLIAFSTTLEEFPDALDQSFRPDCTSTAYKKHDCLEGPRRNRRIIVVEIRYDPRMISAEQLANWERGRYGEIFS